jgi:hypothetical protein
MKRVRETKAGQSISAWIITRGKKHIATVQAHYSDAGRVTVNIWECGEEMQIGSAGGYGYDKLTAALKGLTVAGIKLNDNCGTDKRTTRILKAYHADKITREEAEKRASKIGARFANWNSEKNKHDSLYLEPGLTKLEMLGFTIIQAI